MAWLRVNAPPGLKKCEAPIRKDRERTDVLPAVRRAGRQAELKLAKVLVGQIGDPVDDRLWQESRPAGLHRAEHDPRRLIRHLRDGDNLACGRPEGNKPVAP